VRTKQVLESNIDRKLNLFNFFSWKLLKFFKHQKMINHLWTNNELELSCKDFSNFYKDKDIVKYLVVGHTL